MNIAAYCRVSTDKEDQLNSLETQKEFFLEYTKRTGDNLIKLYADEGISGTKIKNRKEFQRMLADAEKGLFDMVVVKDISRFARNTVDLLQSVRKLKALGIETQFLTANMTSMGNSEFVLTIFGALAQEESANTSKRIKFGKKMNAEKGRVPNIVYGYDKTIGDYFNLSINEEEAKVIRQMYKWYTEEGFGGAKIANMLNERGVKTKRGNNWSQNSVCRILTNEIYTGKIINGKEEVADFLTGQRKEKDESEWLVTLRPELRIIDDETFYVVQANLDARANMYANKPHTPVATCSNALLSGFIFCGHCGARLCVTTSGKGRPRKDGSDPTRTRYTCQTKSRTHGDCDGQTGYTVRKLDAMIDTILHGIFARIGSMRREDAIRACYSGNHDAQQTIFQKVKRDYEKAEQNLQTLKDEVVKSLTGESAFEPNILDMAIRGQEEKCAELRRAMAHAEEEAAKSQATAEHIAKQYDEILEWAQLYDNCNISMKKVIVANMIDRVDVFRDYQLTIRLNITIEQFLISLENVA